MPAIDFYLLDSADRRIRLTIACRLAEKALHKGYRPLMLSESPAQQSTLDDLLWTFRTGSFVPHTTDTESHPAAAEVRLGLNMTSVADIDLVINLQPSVPNFPQNIERIIEIVDQTEETRLPGRKRYRIYQQNGMPIKTHKISGQNH
ncbi:MAG: DNA polymerase III subunit chi [Methylococcales bacterium]|nr:DNA polymerase III subunit chi [Methylococcales bacterium]